MFQSEFFWLNQYLSLNSFISWPEVLRKCKIKMHICWILPKFPSQIFFPCRKPRCQSTDWGLVQYSVQENSNLWHYTACWLHTKKMMPLLMCLTFSANLCRRIAKFTVQPFQYWKKTENIFICIISEWKVFYEHDVNR